MDQKRLRINGKRMAMGCLLGAVLAVMAPFLTLTQLFAGMPLMLLGSAGLMAIYAWAGRGAAVISAVLQLLSYGYALGPAFMWAAFFVGIEPLLVLARMKDRPFFVQIRQALISFGVGLVFAALVLYLEYGGGMVDSLLGGLPDMFAALPAEQLEGYLALYPGLNGSAADFMAMLDQLLGQIVPNLKLMLPAQLFAGAMLTAVGCVTVLCRMRARAKIGAAGSYVPPARWYLPGSASTGLLLVLIVSYALSYTGMRGGEAVFYAVLEIAAWAFCLQALASISRRLDAVGMKHGTKTALLIVMAAAAMLGASLYLAIYGLASALMGSRGAVRQYLEEKQKENNGGSDNGNE